MSRTYSTVRDKNQKDSNVNYRAYLNNPNEPRGHIRSYMLEELEAELLENSVPMRHRIRSLARTLRRNHA